MNVPKNSLMIDKEHKGIGLYVRSDKQNLLDLNINADTLIDRKSGLELSKYLVKRVSYK